MTVNEAVITAWVIGGVVCIGTATLALVCIAAELWHIRKALERFAGYR